MCGRLKLMSVSEHPFICAHFLCMILIIPLQQQQTDTYLCALRILRRGGEEERQKLQMWERRCVRKGEKEKHYLLMQFNTTAHYKLKQQKEKKFPCTHPQQHKRVQNNLRWPTEARLAFQIIQRETEMEAGMDRQTKEAEEEGKRSSRRVFWHLSGPVH